MKQKNFLIVIIIMLGIITCLAFMSCNDSGTTSHTIDSTKVETPKVTDTTKAAYFIQKAFQDAPTSYLINGEGTTVKEGESIQELISSVPENGRATFFLPANTYQGDITIYNRSVWLIGSNGTIIKGTIKISRDHYIYPCKLANLQVENGSVKIGSISSLENVTVKNSPGNGFEFTADIVSDGTDISHSFVSNCEAIQCAGDGFYFHGGDANAMTVLNCSARDNQGWGFNDQSFLGNYFFGSMAHNNGKGHYKSGDTNNANVRTAWFASYGEGGSPPSQLWGASKVFGGINASDWELHHWATTDVK